MAPSIKCVIRWEYGVGIGWILDINGLGWGYFCLEIESGPFMDKGSKITSPSNEFLRINRYVHRSQITVANKGR